MGFKVQLGSRLPRQLWEIRQIIESARGGLEDSIKLDAMSWLTNTAPSQVWSLDASIRDALIDALGTPDSADALLARTKHSTRQDMQRVWMLVQMDVRAETLRFVIHYSLLSALHRLMYAVELSLGRKFSVLRNYPLAVAELCEILDVKRNDIENEFYREIECLRGGKRGTSTLHRDGLFHLILESCSIDHRCLQHMFAAAEVAYRIALSTWGLRDSIPSRLLAEYLFLRLRHTVLSTWEDEVVAEAN